MPDRDTTTRTEGEGETLDMPEGLGTFSNGQVLGERYQILDMLGRGGMGEVWHAFDLKLRVEVALKALRPEFFKSERRLELLRQEVRAAREVMSPNVCRIFDLIEIEGRELVSMEYVDGATLLGVLQERGPLDLKEAQDIASQFLAGLEAIHKVGLIHRDIKPENIMLTRAGRVVVMDFGLARQETEGGGSVSGTPAYMAPEQAAGQQLDARADVYAAGVVLAEMVSPEGIKNLQSRQSVWEGVRSEPAQVPDSPWAPVIQRAVARDRERRQNSAHTLIRELEDVTLRVEGAEDLHPYPGLASFTEEGAEYFFGREAEVEQMWRKLEGPARLLAVIGPSGAGKTSLIRAGLVPRAPAGWSIVRVTPGTAAVASLRRALVPALHGDDEALGALATGEDEATISACARWQAARGRALLVVDQFEELFTQNPVEEQRRCAEVLGRMVLEADVHVLICMRDDFAAACGEHEPLQPAFQDLTVLNAPSGANLRRALVQPATTCGYRFEDDELVEEMLAEVEGERGVLPMLAFAAARLWEMRDRESGLLTRQAYRDIGGVGGALARHAEATIEHIGHERIPLVRELFRNLVTAEGTRAVREWDDLLSVFEAAQRTPADEVVRELINARLLTSYEVKEEDTEPVRRVEIIHESLLANWPRLVRWQTQDQEGAQIRDELRQAAKAWDEHGRHDDRLWTGTAYREYQLWRERYPGGLTDVEEAFGAAMTALAGRRRRRRQMAVASVIATLVIGLAIVGSFWRRSVRETRRAEAQKLVALAQLEMEGYPTAALAYATSSLELADDDTARFLALQALWQGPTAFVVNETASTTAQFSPDGRWMVQAHDQLSSLAVISQGGDQQLLDLSMNSGTTRTTTSFRMSRDFFVSFGEATDTGRFAFWSARDGRLLSSIRLQDPLVYGPDQVTIDTNDGESRALFATGDAAGEVVSVDALYADGRHEHVGRIQLQTPFRQGSRMCMAPASPILSVVDGRDVSVVNVGSDLSDRRQLGRRIEGRPFHGCRFDPSGRFFLIVLLSGEIQVWDATGVNPPRTLVAPPRTVVDFSADGSFIFGIKFPAEGSQGAEILIWAVAEDGFHLLRRDEINEPDFFAFDPIGPRIAMRGPLPAHRLWGFGAPAGAEPTTLRSGPEAYSHAPSFSPDGQWLATNGTSGTKMWPLAREYSSTIGIDFKPWSHGVAFPADGRFLATSAGSEVREWPLEGRIPAAGNLFFERPGAVMNNVAVSPSGEVFAVGNGREMWLGRRGDPPQLLPSSEELMMGTGLVTFSPDGKLVAAANGALDLSRAEFHVWRVSSGEEIAVLRVDGEEMRLGSSFTDDGHLLTGFTSGVVAWDVETGKHEPLIEIPLRDFAASADGRRLLVMEGQPFGANQNPEGPPIFFDLDSGEATELSAHGGEVQAMAVDKGATIAVTGDSKGIIRVGPVTGEEPHLLLGHDGEILCLAIDPKGRWIASGGMDGTARLWPMPDLSKPPLHTLPREELIAKLKTLTNLRVVRDEESSTGWKIEVGPFPGWETVPEW